MDIVALDKTGTVTAGEPRVTDLLPAESVTEEELLRRNYELLYLTGRVDEMIHPPYDVFYRQEPFSFRLKTTIKRMFPSLHALYRSRQGYKE